VASYKKYHCDVAVKYKVLMPDIIFFHHLGGGGSQRDEIISYLGASINFEMIP
jgi:hypothetical protein